MFLGPGIQGNRVIGETDEKQFAQTPESQDPLITLVDDKGIRVRPEHIHEALRTIRGYR